MYYMLANNRVGFFTIQHYRNYSFALNHEGNHEGAPTNVVSHHVIDDDMFKQGPNGLLKWYSAYLGFAMKR